jgi:hypothetical protein
MSTRVYGRSDDLIEFEGDVPGEVGCYAAAEDKGVLLTFSDGTVLLAKYGKAEAGIWAVELIHPGALLERIDECTDEDAKPYSDVAHFRDGLKWIFAAKEWERVQ